MRLTSFLQNGELTLELTGEIDHHSAKELIQCIEGKLEAYTPQICVLNFESVTFMDSSGIAVVINALRIMNRMGGKLFISGLNEQPLKVFRASGMERMIEIKEVFS